MTHKNLIPMAHQQNKSPHHPISDELKEREEQETHVFLERNLITAAIYDGGEVVEILPPSFNAAKITLDGRVQADLSWKKEREIAVKYRELGVKIFWELDLGLLGELKFPLNNQTQFLSLKLSLEHFCNTLWKEFSDITIGICLYKGPLDVSRAYVWDEEQVQNLQNWMKDRFNDVKTFQEKTLISISGFSDLNPEILSHSNQGLRLLMLFCREALGEYLDLLAGNLPEWLPYVALFDLKEINEDSLAAELVANKSNSPIIIGVNGVKGGIASDLLWNTQSLNGIFGRQNSHLQSFLKPTTGICLPNSIIAMPEFEEALKVCKFHHIPFRIIPESRITAEWDEIDYLLVASDTVNVQTKRKLQGFCAAGGAVVYIGRSIGLPQEIELSQWLRETHR